MTIGENDHIKFTFEEINQSLKDVEIGYLTCTEYFVNNHFTSIVKAYFVELSWIDPNCFHPPVRGSFALKKDDAANMVLIDAQIHRDPVLKKKAHKAEQIIMSRREAMEIEEKTLQVNQSTSNQRRL